MKSLLLLLLLASLPAWAQVDTWTFAYPVSDANGLMDVATGNDGAVYITGRFTDSLQLGSTRLTSPGLCLYIAKCDPKGRVLRVTKLRGATDVLPYSIAVDRAGNSYVTGTVRGKLVYNQGRDSTVQLSAAGSNAFTLKCRANGAVAWIRRGEGSTGPQAGSGGGEGIAVDATGNSYVTGTVSGTNVRFGTRTFGPRYQQAFLVSYTPEGALRWANVWTGLNPNDRSSSHGGGVALNSAGDCYVSGTFATGLTLDGLTLQSPDGQGHLFLARFDKWQGQLQWAVVPAGGGNGRGVATSRQGDAYLVGSFVGTATYGSTTLTSAGDADGFVACYNPQGTVKWATAVGGRDYDVAIDIAVTPKSGKAYVTGLLDLTSQSTNRAFLLKLTRRGRIRQQELVAGPGTSTGANLALGSQGNIYSAGIFTNSCGFGSIILNSAVTQGFFGCFGSQAAQYKEAKTPLAVSVFPNPAQSKFTLRLTGAEQAVRATLYDRLGNALAVHTLPPATAATNADSAFDTSALPNGLYTLRLEFGKQTTSRTINVQH